MATKESNINNKVNYLMRTLRKRYKKNSELFIGIISIVAGERLIKSFYKKHKCTPKVLELRSNIAKYLLDVKNELVNND